MCLDTVTLLTALLFFIPYIGKLVVLKKICLAVENLFLTGNYERLHNPV